MSFEGFYSSELRSLGIKTIWKLAYKEFLATKNALSAAQKPSKGFLMFFSKKLFLLFSPLGIFIIFFHFLRPHTKSAEAP